MTTVPGMWPVGSRPPSSKPSSRRVREAGLNRSDYLRQVALARRLVIARTTRADPALIAELNRIGVNLNQMARTANGTGRVPPELIRLCEKIEQLVMRAVEEEVG
jgi:hypothetical protein